jgi:hypothetical protein
MFVGMKWVLLSASLFSSVVAFSQDTSITFSPRIKFNDVIIHGGLIFQSEYNITLDDYKELVPESVLLKNDLSQYSEDHTDYCKKCYDFEPAWSLGVQAGFKIFNQKNKKYSNTEFRTGLYYSWKNFSETDLYHVTRESYDSVEKDNSKIYHDSVWSSLYSFRHQWQQLNADITILFTLNPRSYVSFATGVGIAGGLAFSRKTTIGFGSYIDTLSRDSNNTPDDIYNANYYSSLDSVNWESFEHKATANFIFYIPIEMNIHFNTQNHPKVNWFYLILQCHPGIHFLSMPKDRFALGFMMPLHGGVGFYF